MSMYIALTDWQSSYRHRSERPKKSSFYTGRLNFLPCMTLSHKHQLKYSSTRGRRSLGIINPEEVRVQDCLYDAGHPRDLINVTICEVSIKPVRDIQCPVHTECEDVVRRDSFSFSGPLKHEELGENRNRLEPYRKRPHDLYPVIIPFLCWEQWMSNLREGVLVRKEYRNDSTPSQKILHLECVDARVVGWLIVSDHQVYRVCRGAEKEKLEGSVPCRVCERPKNI